MFWIKCTDEMPRADERVVMWVVLGDDPSKGEPVEGVRADFQRGMFLDGDDPFRPLKWISHWALLRTPEKIRNAGPSYQGAALSAS